jgi:hypothetical protein
MAGLVPAIHAVPPPLATFYSFNVSYKSSQPGLEFTISWAFQARGQCFMFDWR